MRLDYVSYAVAIVFFIVTITAVVLSMSTVDKQVWVVSTVVIGLALIGVGYTQRPRPSAAPSITSSAPPPPPSQPQVQQAQQQPEQQPAQVTTALAQPTVTEVVKLEETKPAVEPIQPTAPVEEPTPAVEPIQPVAGGLTDVKGIGEKRASQLKALGILNVEDLSKASSKDLATKLNISPKITAKWIQGAKEIEQKP